MRPSRSKSRPVLRQAHALDHLAHRAHRARSAHRLFPAPLPVFGHDGFHLQQGRQARLLQALAADAAIGKEASGEGNAAHVQALHAHRFEAFAQDDLGGAAADVHHQARAAGIGQAVGHTQIDEARLLHAGDDLHRVAEHLFGMFDEFPAVAGAAQRIGADHAYTAGRHVAQQLAEAGEAGHGPFHGLGGQAPVGVQSGRQPDHFPFLVDDLQIAVAHPGDDQMEAVGAQIHRGHLVDTAGVQRPAEEAAKDGSVSPETTAPPLSRRHRRVTTQENAGFSPSTGL